MSSLAAEKSALRRRILAERKRLGAAARRRASERICAQIQQLAQYQQARCLAAFAPMAEEVDIWALITGSLAQRKIVALPRVADAARRQLTFHEFSGRDELTGGYKNIPEPPAAKKIISMQLFDFILVPAVAADKNGKRLGYGGGFYDKVLANCRNAYSCAPVFRCQRIDLLPCEKHDQSVSSIITD